MHFFNPAPVMKAGRDHHHARHRGRRGRDRPGTDRQRRQGRRLGRRPLRLHRQPAPLPLPQRRHQGWPRAARSLATIDAAIKETASLPDGPLRVRSTWSATTCRWPSRRSLYGEFGEPGFAPAKTLEEKVAAGGLGRKTGKGFHTY
ncbi:3-hydroxyacyl-CoA dehydrogenase family protein [Nocardioides convexus]|uniref:3-hydroxyacyl-CoA dehydrogenase family protein n=1 Tax=Nocardioides convexus TaxID=2712224 RepID=UPI0024187F99|nr:3-hydroxyacyl-CoA dehydrogenase family protein [Nocardioides convexus]